MLPSPDTRARERNKEQGTTRPADEHFRLPAQDTFSSKTTHHSSNDVVVFGFLIEGIFYPKEEAVELLVARPKKEKDAILAAAIPAERHADGSVTTTPRK